MCTTPPTPPTISSPSSPPTPPAPVSIPAPAPPVSVSMSVARPAPTPSPPVSVPAPVSVSVSPISVSISVAAPTPAPSAVTISLSPSLLHISPPKASNAILFLLNSATCYLQHLGFPLESSPHLHRLLQLCQFLPDLYEAEVQLAAEVVGQPPVVVVYAEVGGTHLAHSQLLLLVRAGWHGVPVLLLGLHLPLPEVLHLLHQLDALLHVPIRPELLCSRQLLPDVLRQLVDRVGLVRHLLAQRVLGLSQRLLGLLDLLVAVADEGGEMVAGVHVVEVIFFCLSCQVVRSEGDVVHPRALTHVHPGGREDVVGTAVEQERLADDFVVISRGGGLSWKRTKYEALVCNPA